MSNLPTPQTRLLISVANELGRAIDNIWGLANNHHLQTADYVPGIIRITLIELNQQWETYRTRIHSIWPSPDINQWLIRPECLGGTAQQPQPPPDDARHQPPTLPPDEDTSQ